MELKQVWQKNKKHLLTKESSPDSHLHKSEVIKSILELNMEDLNENKMFALYGGWGSGKSTMMDYIKREVKDCKTVFFEAWEHEFDEDITTSLFELIVDKKSIDNQVSKDFFKSFKALIKGGLKATSISVGVPGVGDIKFNPKEIINELEKANSKEDSFYYKRKEFKKQFVEFENEVLKEGEKLIVFIDDLDRCEPENVLKLMACIKLFFTLGNRTIFLFGVDKKAVSQAIKTKYGDVIKSEEYLEKVFDMSFAVPELDDIRGLITSSFPSWDEHCYSSEIAKMFKSMGFVTPRHIKKVLNRYRILFSFIEKKVVGPKLMDTNFITPVAGEGVWLFDTYLLFYLIILFEFNKEKFNEVKSFDKRFNSQVDFMELRHKEKGNPPNRTSMYGSQQSTLTIKTGGNSTFVKDIQIDDFKKAVINVSNGSTVEQVSVLFYFTLIPSLGMAIEIGTADLFISQVKAKDLLIGGFLEFLNKDLERSRTEEDLGDKNQLTVTELIEFVEMYS